MGIIYKALHHTTVPAVNGTSIMNKDICKTQTPNSWASNPRHQVQRGLSGSPEAVPAELRQAPNGLKCLPLAPHTRPGVQHTSPLPGEVSITSK